jgi:small-conductance mechanosensitive channel
MIFISKIKKKKDYVFHSLFFYLNLGIFGSQSGATSALTFVGLTTVLSGLAAGSPGKASAVHD